MPWKLKTTPEGAPVVKDGLPMFVDPNGADAVFDPNVLQQKLLEVNAESKERREALAALKQKYATFDGIEDLAAYRTEAEEALKLKKNLKDKDLVEAGRVEEVKAELKKAAAEAETRLKDQAARQVAELLEKIQKKDGQIRRLVISNLFGTSRFFSGKEPVTTLPPDIAEAHFGERFQVREDPLTGRPVCVALDAKGEPMLSRTRIGEIATFDEAVEMLIDGYAQKQMIVRQQGGSGGTGGTGGISGGTPLAQMRAAYAEAQKCGDVKTMVSLTTRIAEAERREREGK
jgi:hypothetical protein